MSGGLSAAAAAFSAHAPEYTERRRRLVPHFDAFYGAAVDALSLPGVRTPERVLDLGAGTGLLTAAIAGAFPAARFDLLDGSAEMLAEARERLEAVIDAVIVADFAEPLPAGPYDAVVSALAIHHLDDAAKRDLFGRVRRVLAPGGVFVNAEQVASVRPDWDEAYRARWASDAAAQGATAAEIADARVRRSHDRCASVSDQLAWLAAAGFDTVDVLWKSWEGAVLVACRGPQTDA